MPGPGVPGPRGVCVETPPPPTATAVGGMHPTGMHFCFNFIQFLEKKVAEIIGWRPSTFVVGAPPPPSEKSCIHHWHHKRSHGFYVLTNE